jgi:hypothetical protein
VFLDGFLFCAWLQGSETTIPSPFVLPANGGQMPIYTGSVAFAEPFKSSTPEHLDGAPVPIANQLDPSQ